MEEDGWTGANGDCASISGGQMVAADVFVPSSLSRESAGDAVERVFDRRRRGRFRLFAVELAAFAAAISSVSTEK